MVAHPPHRLILTGLVLTIPLLRCNVLAGLNDYRDGEQAPGGASSSGSVAPTCTDNTQDGDETGVDCGGPACPACATGGGCRLGPDCQSKVCNSGTCVAPRCDDKVQNGNETDVDCGGGSCPACAESAMCRGNGDCAGGACAQGKCSASCGDKKQDGNETDVDCGGSCSPCAVGKGCAVGADCQSHLCVSQTCASNYAWAKQFGGTLDQTGEALVVDPLGQTYLVSQINGSVDFGGGPKSAAVKNTLAAAKFDPSGKQIWSTLFTVGTLLNGASPNSLSSVVLDRNSNMLFTGSVEQGTDFGGGAISTGYPANLPVVKLDTGGTHVWTRAFPGAAGDAIAVGGPYGMTSVSGRFFNSMGTASFKVTTVSACGTVNLSGTAAQDMLIMQLGSSGDCNWVRTFGDGVAGHYSEARGVAVDSKGNTLVTGTIQGNVKLDATTLAGQASGSTNAAFLAKLDINGTVSWAKSFAVQGDAGSNDQMATAISVGPADDIAITGSFTGTIDFGKGALASQGATDIFVAKFDSTGAPLWSKSFGGPKFEQATRVTIDPGGNIILVGAMGESVDFGGGPLPNDGNGSAFVAKFDPSGVHLFSQSFGSIGAAQANDVAAFEKSSVFLTGDFSGQIDFGGGAMTTLGGKDIFLAKLITP